MFKTVGVVGLGYVGLPLAAAFADTGRNVIGLDIDAQRIGLLTSGRSYVIDVNPNHILSLLSRGKLSLSTQYASLSLADAVIICVPTPLRKTKDPDMSYIMAAVEGLRPFLRKGQLVVLESTTYPGTTREVVLPELEKSGLVCGQDFHLAFSPERVDPGNQKFGIRNTPKVVGGITPACAELAAALYGLVVEKVVPVSSTECAEMVKLLENTFRAVNIGLVNEMALICDKLKLDAWEVIDAAATKPFGFMPFYPGPGIGGHCIPLDPHYLSWKMRTLNFTTRFIDLAGEINSHMPDHLVSRVADGLNRQGKAVKGSKLLVLGAAYKRNIGDVRESPALDVMTLLRDRGAVVDFHDPYVAEVRLGEGAVVKGIDLTDEALASRDAVVIVTDHGAFDMQRIVEKAQLVVDGRNATRGLSSEKIIKL